MVRLLGLVKGYTPIKVNLPESGRVKINIRASLLNPAGKTIVGTFHFNGTTVYLPQDANITIGSSPKCDIRIKDPAVQPFHTMIHSIGELSATGENATIEHLHMEGKTGILTSSNEIKTIAARDEALALANGDRIILPLSGNKKLLPVEFKLRRPFASEIKESLVTQLQPRPAVQQVSVERVLVEQTSIQAETLPPPLKTLVAGTPFAAARTLDDVFALLPGKRYTAKRNDHIMLFCSTDLLLGGLSVPVLWPNAINFSTALVPSIIVASLSTASMLIGFVTVMINGVNGHRRDLSASLAHVLSNANPDEVARSLAKLDQPERDKVISVLRNSDSVKADAVLIRLPEILREKDALALPPKA